MSAPFPNTLRKEKLFLMIGGLKMKKVDKTQNKQLMKPNNLTNLLSWPKIWKKENILIFLKTKLNTSANYSNV
jgi:hypothetical protein